MSVVRRLDISLSLSFSCLMSLPAYVSLPLPVSPPAPTYICVLECLFLWLCLERSIWLCLFVIPCPAYTLETDSSSPFWCMFHPGQEPRQTTSNIGHLQRPTITALVHGLNRNYYSIAINCRKGDLEHQMLTNLHKNKWNDALKLQVITQPPSIDNALRGQKRRRQIEAGRQRD